MYPKCIIMRALSNMMDGKYSGRRATHSHPKLYLDFRRRKKRGGAGLEKL